MPRSFNLNVYVKVLGSEELFVADFILDLNCFMKGTYNRIEMLGRFQLLCQFHPSSEEYCKDFSVSMKNLTDGSQKLTVGLVRTIEGLNCHIVDFLPVSVVLSWHSTWVQSHDGFPASDI